ncbi:MAG: DUF4157 domain-containing protein [Actinobacteria bacterium]|nr:DUF4157 domain-containing protein [Actinomycetota bacterium]
MGFVPKVRWQPRPPEPEPPATAVWRAAAPLLPTVGASALVGGAGALARDLLARDAWLASAGRVEVDAPPPPAGRVVALSGKAPRKSRAKAAAGAAKPRAAGRSRSLPTVSPRRIASVGPVRPDEDAPPLTALDLPAGVVPTWDARIAEPPPPPPEPASNSLLQAQPEPGRRVVRRVGLGAPLPIPPPRPAPQEPEVASNSLLLSPEGAEVEERSLVRTHPRRRLERVPDDVRRTVEAVTGVELGEVPVQRGAEVTHVARALGAHAYTVGGVIHLPAEHGSLADPRVKALLAHELVHVAQQKRLGDELPPEDSPYGLLLEQDALAVERTWVAPQLAGVQRRALDAPPQQVTATAPSRSGVALLDSLEPDDLERLAARIYGPIRTRLRRELLVDRERAALLTDVRR